MTTTPSPCRPLTVSMLADQFGCPTGGGRFTSILCQHLLDHARQHPDELRLILLRTQGERMDALQPLPKNVTVITRRFPARLRNSFLARLAGALLPPADIGFGPFYYAFPHQGRNLVVTIHDVSALLPDFHTQETRSRFQHLMSQALRHDQRFVCDSETTRTQLIRAWPQAETRSVCIYPGAGPLPGAQACAILRPNPKTILTVGTIEPRKNYDRLLDAYELLRNDHPNPKLRLVVVGRPGWKCDVTVKRLRNMQAAGLLEWLNNASESRLAQAYAEADIFTYPSLYEGFGYPPFEAAFAGLPMVLSNRSSVGEIWNQAACTVDPENPRAMAEAWKTMLDLSPARRRAIVDQQRCHAERFSWPRCIREYLAYFSTLALQRHASSPHSQPA